VIFTTAEADQKSIRSAGLSEPQRGPVEDVGVDHRGADVPVAEQLKHELPEGIQCQQSVLRRQLDDPPSRLLSGNQPR